VGSDITSGLFALGGALVGAGASSWQQGVSRRHSRRDRQAHILTDFVDELDGYLRVVGRDWGLATRDAPDSVTAPKSSAVTLDAVRESSRRLSAAHTKVQVFVPHRNLRKLVDNLTDEVFEISSALEAWEARNPASPGHRIEVVGPVCEFPFEFSVRAQDGLQSLESLIRSRYTDRARDKFLL
jgi:hypothetical protein